MLYTATNRPILTLKIFKTHQLSAKIINQQQETRKLPRARRERRGNVIKLEVQARKASLESDGHVALLELAYLIHRKGFVFLFSYIYITVLVLHIGHPVSQKPLYIFPPQPHVLETHHPLGIVLVPRDDDHHGST
jgi:hypothetical protein